MADSNFQGLFKKLNPEQRRAVETINGPVMVIAGPGTGKTQILTLRIANILLKTDAKPENILALTFTESAAANMRRRLVSLIGTSGYYINISTFHGFCNDLIKDYPENFSKIIGGKNISPVGQLDLIRKIIESNDLKHLKPFGYKFYYASEILKSIKKLKNEGLKPDDFKKLAAASAIKNSQRYQELAAIYNKYQAELVKNRLYDFDDMVLETISALKNQKEFLLDLQEKYQYILVDEHQDTNGAQNKVLELLASYDDSPNLFVVGDDKQAIFRFQGASLENFLYFKKKYAQARLIELKSNYRSTQKILDGADSLIRHNQIVLSHSQLKSNTIVGSKIKISAAADAGSENIFVAETIKCFLKNKKQPEEIAVLYRENKDAQALGDILERCGISYAIESDENILENADIKKINILFKAISHYPENKSLIPALHIDFLNLNPVEIYKFIASNAESPLVAETLKKISAWKILSHNETLPKLFEKVINQSGFLKYLLAQKDYHHRIKRLNKLFAEIKKAASENHNYNLADYLNHLDVISEHSLPWGAKLPTTDKSVRLMTAHRAKGLEFETVFVTGAYNGHWGNKRKRDILNVAELINAKNEIDANEDERRLFYMALTRAKKDVYITYSKLSAEGKEQAPCQFINEIKEGLKEEIEILKGKSPIYESLLLAGKTTRPGLDEKNFIKNLFLKRGLSPTSLNNYLACPWRFLYTNLLRIPQTETGHQVYGTAKHYALQKFFEAKQKNIRADARVLTKSFIESLKERPITSPDYQQLRQKGLATLPSYYNFYKNSWNYNTVTEFKISGIDFNIAKNQSIRLTGKLDKIEILQPNKSGVMVVDYKTKAPESRNWILGKTKDPRGGDYFRQLVFYKLLLDSHPSKKYNMSAGVIDFTEPDNKGRFKKESFEITAAAVADLKELIRKSADSVINFKFHNQTCNDKKCPYCAFREFLPQSRVIQLKP